MYPPEHHVEQDAEKIYRVIEALSFATLISRSEDDVVVTQLPLMLERERGEKGMLIGHIDRYNPHSNYLDDEKAFVLFQGPHTYISPNVYESSQLPTWNSISVHIRGTVRTQTSENLKESLIKMTSFLETSEEAEDPYVLEPDSPRMLSLLNYIVGFEIEIEEMTGRFKLSQDKDERDKELAKEHLISSNKNGYEELIDLLI